MSSVSADDMKRAVGYALVEKFAKSGMKIGLGTGSTSIWAIRRLAELIKAGKLRDIVGVPTSFAAENQARDLGLEVHDLNDPLIGGQVDLAFDGADEISPEAYLIKGAGAAMVGEKLVEHTATQFVVIADSSKLVDQLGLKFPVPVEVVRQARIQVTKVLEAWGAKVKLREGSGKIGPVVTDNGNIILDAYFEGGLAKAKISHPVALEAAIKALPGVVESGLFSCPVAAVLVGYSDGRVEEFKLKKR